MAFSPQAFCPGNVSPNGSALNHLCDREPEEALEAMARIEAFRRHLIKTREDTEKGSTPKCH